MAKIGTKQNAAKEAVRANRVKPPDFRWLNVDRYDKSSRQYIYMFIECISKYKII